MPLEQSRGSSFKVMTFNLLMFNRRFQGSAASIAASGAHIVALQELSEHAAQAIGSRLEHRYRYQSLHPAGGASGGGVLSSFPIVGDEVVRLSKQGHVCQHLVLELPDRPLHFFNIHLTAPSFGIRPLRYDPKRREAEAAALAGLVAAYPRSLVVVGDFNMTDRSGAYRRLTRVLRDSFKEAGVGDRNTFPNRARLGPVRLPLWPAPFPIMRIDYVFHSDDIRAREVHRGNGDGSDHCPLIATLAFAEG